LLQNKLFFLYYLQLASIDRISEKYLRVDTE